MAENKTEEKKPADKMKEQDEKEKSGVSTSNFDSAYGDGFPQDDTSHSSRNRDYKDKSRPYDSGETSTAKT